MSISTILDISLAKKLCVLHLPIVHQGFVGNVIQIALHRIQYSQFHVRRIFICVVYTLHIIVFCLENRNWENFIRLNHLSGFNKKLPFYKDRHTILGVTAPFVGCSHTIYKSNQELLLIWIDSAWKIRFHKRHR